MARSYVALILEAVEQLHAELLRIHHSVRGIAPWAMDASQDIANVRASLRRAFKVTRGIREHVLDGELDSTSNDVRSWALRARAVVTALQLSELDMAARNVTVSMTPDGRSRDVDAFRSRVLEHVGRVNAKWMQQSRGLTRDDGERLAAILTTAESEYSALGCDADVRCFLLWGAACEDAAFARACKTLRVLFDMRDEQAVFEVPSLPRIGHASGGGN